MTELQYQQLLIEAALDNNIEEFKKILMDRMSELTDAQRWSILSAVVDYVSLVEAAEEEEEGKPLQQQEALSIFEHAIKESNIEMVEAIFEAPGLNEDNRFDLLTRSIGSGYTTLSEAATECDINLMKLLVKYTRNLPYYQRINLLNNTIAALNECDACYLIDDTYDNNHDKLRTILSFNGIVQVILESCSDLTIDEKIAGFYPNHAENPHAALMASVRYNDTVSIGRFAVSSELLLKTSEDGAQDTALIAAIRNGHREAMECILSFIDTTSFSRADIINLKNAQDDTALSVIIKSDDAFLMQCILSGLDIEQEFALLQSAMLLEKSDRMVAILEAKLKLNEYKRKLLLSKENPEDLYILLKEVNQDGNAVLKQAMMLDDGEMVFNILDHMNALSCEQRLELLTPNFILAIKNPNSTMLSLLLNAYSILPEEHRVTAFDDTEVREAFIVAARFGYKETISKMLFSYAAFSPEFVLAFLNAIDEKVGPEDTALIAAGRNGHLESVCTIFSHCANFTLEQKKALLMRANAQGETLLMVVAANDRIDIADEIVTYAKDANLVFDLLIQQDKDGKAAWMYAIEHEEMKGVFASILGKLVYDSLRYNTTIAEQLMESINEKFKYFILANIIIGKAGLLTHAVQYNNVRVINAMLANLLLEERCSLLSTEPAIEVAAQRRNTHAGAHLLEIIKKTLDEFIISPDKDEYDINLIIDLLSSIPSNIKFEILEEQNSAGATLLMMAVYFNHVSIVNEMFADLTLEEIGILLNQKNSLGTNALTIAERQGAGAQYFDEMIALLKSLTLKLAFNTHSATVHDSVARSVIALSAYYLSELSLDDKAILNSWADSAPAQEDDSVKRQRMLEVINKDETKAAFINLMQYYEAGINTWIEQLNARDDVIMQAAARGLLLIKNNRAYKDYLENSTQVSVWQILVLAWVAIHDEREYNSNIGIATQLNDKKTALIDTLYQAQRDGNLQNGEDLNPLEEDKPKCQAGFINNLMNALIGLHSHVKVVVVNKETVKLKAMCLVGSLFNTADYDEEQVKQLEKTLEEEYCLTKEVQAHLEPQVEGALHTEFDDFVKTKFLSPQDIPSITGAVLIFQSPNSYTAVQVIQDKLQADLRLHPKPEQKPDDETSVQENKKARLR